MTDISLCDGYNCPIKQKCYRFKAEPSEYGQSYFLPPIYQEDSDKECEYFLTIRGRK